MHGIRVWRASLLDALESAADIFGFIHPVVRVGRSGQDRFEGCCQVMPQPPIRAGSREPSTHMRCRTTAILRATATMARRRPLVFISRTPQAFRLRPGDRAHQHGVGGRVEGRAHVGVAGVEMRPGLSFSPDWKRLGVSPKWAPTVRELLKRAGSSTAALKLSAVISPTPGTPMKRAADRVLAGRRFDAPIELDEGLEEHLPGLQHRQQGVAQRRIAFDGVAHGARRRRRATAASAA